MHVVSCYFLCESESVSHERLSRICLFRFIRFTSMHVVSCYFYCESENVSHKRVTSQRRYLREPLLALHEQAEDFNLVSKLFSDKVIGCIVDRFGLETYVDLTLLKVES